MIKVSEGLLVLHKRQRRPEEGVEIWVHPNHFAGVEPHRNGCYVYAGGHKWDVEHSHVEIAQMIANTRQQR